MARYYFDVHVDDNLTIDDEGLELSSRERAWAEAARSVGEMARDQITKHNGAHKVMVEVRDPRGPLLLVSATCTTEQFRLPEFAPASARSNELLSGECLRLLHSFSNVGAEERAEVLALAEKYANEFPQFAEALQRLKRVH